MNVNKEVVFRFAGDKERREGSQQGSFSSAPLGVSGEWHTHALLSIGFNRRLNFFDRGGHVYRNLSFLLRRVWESPCMSRVLSKLSLSRSPLLSSYIDDVL